MREPIPAHERAAILDRVAAVLVERADDTARTISAEAGKPMKAARVEASRAVSTFTMAAVEARKLAGDVVPMDASPAGAGKLAFTLRQPIGVVGAISPFNFPLNLVAHKVAPALAAGCAVVLKPASQTPLSALFLAELETEAGLPAGWLNVVCGPAEEIGDVLVEDDRVKLITFTGSAPIGWKLRERAARKRVNLELGNATPVIVAADADLDDAAQRLAANAFSFAGQSCISVQRIYVERSCLRRVPRALHPACRGAHGRRPRGRGDRCRPPDLRGRPGSHPRVDRGGEGRGRRRADRRHARGRALAADRDRRGSSRREGLLSGGVRAALHRYALRHARRGDRARQLHAVRPPGRNLHPQMSRTRSARHRLSSSAE